MAVTSSFTGRQGTVSVAGTFLPITKWTAKITKEFADATDSNTFDVATDQVWKYQDPGCIGIEGTIEGNFDLSTTDAQVVQAMKQDGPFPVTLGLTRSTNFMVNSYVDFTDVELTVDVPGATMVTFSLSWKSHGIPTLP